MRQFANFPEAINEIRRELKEMGIRVKTNSVQNIDITDKPEYETMELQNYQYMVLAPDYNDIPLKVPEWAEAEFGERVGGAPLNPGSAWQYRKEYWEKFINPDRGGFDYSYPQRMTQPLTDVLKLLREDINTRRAWLPVFDRSMDDVSALDFRIPCTLGYWFNFRQGQLNMTYALRSSDFFEHFNYDIYLADRLKTYVAAQLGVKPGFFCHTIFSLHCFLKDVKDVF